MAATNTGFPHPACLPACMQVGWTKDGQVLTVGTTNGMLVSYLAALPVVSDFYGTQVRGPPPHWASHWGRDRLFFTWELAVASSAAFQ